jgi:hypothetical protein
MTTDATAVMAEFFWCCFDRLSFPSPETSSRLFDARAAAEAVFTKAECDETVLLAHKVCRHGSWC